MSSPYRGVLFLVFIAVPFLELALLLKAGQMFGFWPTLALVLGTAILGATLLHRQGLATFRRIFSDFEGGQVPVESVADGAMIMLAGALLLAPGFLTDITGLLLLVPPVRRVLRQIAFNRVFGREPSSPAASRTGESNPAGHRKSRAGPVVIETEFERLDEETIEPHRRQGN